MLDKFIEPFYKFVRDNFSDFDSQHIFYVNGESTIYKKPQGKNVYEAQQYNLVARYYWLIRNMKRADKIILHGIWDTRVLVLLALQPWHLKKTCWTIWGGDLYCRLREKTIKGKIVEKIREYVIKRLRLITTTVPGDFELAKKWYSTRAVFIQNLMYPSHISREPEKYSPNYENLVVQIGNSADPSNNHFEIIDKLSNLSTPNNIKITAPLSYGDSGYAQQVIDYGKNKLGNKFVPMTSYMDFEQYNEYMATVSIVIFNHKRQQAMGNTIGLLSLGKKVYLRSDVTPWSYLKSLGLHVYDSKSEINFSNLSELSIKNNINICKTEFSTEKLLKSWSEIFQMKL